MQITDILAQMGGVSSLARDLGVSEAQAAAASEALVPAILGGFKKQAQGHEQGLDGFGALLGQLGGGGLLDNVLGPQATNVASGNEILGQIFGSRDVSRTVAKSAAARSGLDPALLQKALPILAMLVAGYMARHGGAAPQAAPAGGGLGGVLGGLLRGAPDLPGAAPGTSAGLASMLDLNGDGNPLDDILAMARKLTS
jgi:hypothetical protein